jgi:hypothetical protein
MDRVMPVSRVAGARQRGQVGGYGVIQSVT